MRYLEKKKKKKKKDHLPCLYTLVVKLLLTRSIADAKGVFDQMTAHITLGQLTSPCKHG